MGKINLRGTDLTIENIFCIGRNYSEHIKELGNVDPVDPIIFQKPTTSVIFTGSNLIIPKQSERVDHEVEIVVALNKSGKNWNEAQALEAIGAIGVGIDFTARDLQDRAKERSLPWTICKGFDTFTALSSFVPPPQDSAKWKDLNFSLEVNGEKKQTGNSSQMISSIACLVAHLSTIFTLGSGDIIFTGTPKGVSSVKPGDQLVAKLEDWCNLTIGVQ